MKIQLWIARREPYWQRLDFLLKKIEKKGIKSLKASEIQELSALYRSVSADLARVFPDANIFAQRQMLV